MKCETIYNIIDSLRKKEPIKIGESEIGYLTQNNLVHILQSRDTTELAQKADEFKKIESTSNTNVYELQELIFDYSDKKHIFDSIFHKGVSVLRNLGFDKLDDEEDEIDDIENKMKSITNKMDLEGVDMDDMEKAYETFSAYVKCGDILIKPTQEALEKIPFLEGYSNHEFEEFDRLQSKEKNIIKKRKERFYQMLNLVKEQDMDHRSHDVMDYALMLSGLNGSVQDIHDLSIEIDGILKTIIDEYETYDDGRLRPLHLAVAAGAENLEKIDHMSDIMINDEYYEGYETLAMAIHATQFPSPANKLRYNRFCNLDEEMNYNDWEEGTSATLYVVSHLGKQKGNESTLAEDFRELEELIIDESDIEDYEESGYAALMLMDIDASMQIRAERFEKAWRLMQDYSDWEEDDDYYVAASIIANTDSIEGNVIRLNEFVDNRPDYMDTLEATYIGLPIITGIYKDIFNEF